jgi:hypothetical protein
MLNEYSDNANVSVQATKSVVRRSVVRQAVPSCELLRSTGAVSVQAQNWSVASSAEQWGASY